MKERELFDWTGSADDPVDFFPRRSTVRTRKKS